MIDDIKCSRQIKCDQNCGFLVLASFEYIIDYSVERRFGEMAGPTGIVSHRSESHHIKLHRIELHRIASHRVPSHRIASHHITSHHTTHISIPLNLIRYIIVLRGIKKSVQPCKSLHSLNSVLYRNPSARFQHISQILVEEPPNCHRDLDIYII